MGNSDTDLLPGRTSWLAPSAIVRALALALALLVLLAACGSSSKATTSGAQVEKQTCQQIEAALSDGPDPGADPVGHAQAQVLPLRQIHTTDAKLHRAIDTLASAYQAFSTSNGADSAKSAVSAATKTIEGLCPGIES
jgi:predicted component of type VI protein secretion system